MYILGISCFYHDSSACLLKDGKVVAAAQEERFNRDKYSPVFPIQSINYCLQEAGITPYDLDHIAFYEKMYLKFERTIVSHLYGYPFTLKNFLETMPLWLKDRLIVPFLIRDELSYKGKIWFMNHHLSHAASTFLVSPFKEAAFLTVDGVGENSSSMYGTGVDSEIRIEKEIFYPHSLGILYSIFTAYLGFRVFSGEGKVMALAEFGEPRYLDEFNEIIDIKEDGSFQLNLKYFSFNRGDKMHNARFEKLFGEPRVEKSEITQRHKDIAATLQHVTEDILLKMGRHVYEQTRMKNLCLAGGVFLNVTANSRIVKELPFENVFIQPAAGDAGSAMGAAFYLHNSILGNPRDYVLKSAALGPSYSNEAIKILLTNNNFEFKYYEEDELLNLTAQHLADDKIIGWFQGRMEFGPRALGNRSILANPCNPNMKDIVNNKVKHREPFRPFGASVLGEDVGRYFDIGAQSPFMLLVADVKDECLGKIPAVTHVNNTSRIQTVTEEVDGIYYRLIREFKKVTNESLLLNTSFNDIEPIVCTPQDAINCFNKTQIDYLVIGNYIVEKKK